MKEENFTPSYIAKPQYTVNSTLEEMGLNLYSYWKLEDGNLTLPADISIRIIFILVGCGYYGNRKAVAGDVVAIGLNKKAIDIQVCKVTSFVLHMDFNFFHLITGLEPYLCHDFLFLDKKNPFYRLGQMLFPHPVIRWKPMIEAYMKNILDERKYSKNSISMERVTYAVKEVSKTCDFHSIAKSMAISHRQLQRDFLSFLGLTLNEYRNIRRFKEAAHSLKYKSITDVAHSVGYYDQSHMNREFKKKSGLTPKQIRIKQNSFFCS